MSQTPNDKKKRAVFTVNEVEVLIQLWSDSRIQKKFASSVRHNIIWEEIATQMRHIGFNRNFTEFKSKINNLKTEYRKVKTSSGSSTPDWPFFKAMHSVLGQKDEEKDYIVVNSFFNDEEPIALDFITEETKCFSSPTKRLRLVEKPRISTVGRPGISGTQYKGTVAEDEDSYVSAEEQEQPKPLRSFKRIPRLRQSQRKAAWEVDQILTFLKSSEERQSQQLEAQNQLLQHFILQEEAANQRDDRVAEAFIKTLNIMSKTLIKQDKRSDSPSSLLTPSMSPPIRVASPTSAFNPAENNENLPQPKILYVSASSPSYRSQSTQFLPDPLDPSGSK